MHSLIGELKDRVEGTCTHDRGLSPYLIFPKFCQPVPERKSKERGSFPSVDLIEADRIQTGNVSSFNNNRKVVEMGAPRRRSRNPRASNPRGFFLARARFYSAHGKQFCPIINRAIVGGWCMLLAHFIHPSVMVTR